MADKTITLPIGDIVITLIDEDKQGKFNSGSISTNLKETCSYCNNEDCDMDCPNYGEHCNDRDPDIQRQKEEEGIKFRLYNTAIDAIESMILAQACAGIDVESEKYIISLQACLDSIGNNL